MAGLSAPGIGSGLDVNSIVSQLMNVEKQPLTLLDQREASYQAQLTAYGTLKGAVSTFQSAMAGLADATSFQLLKATPGDSTIFTADASPTAASGSYAISVDHIAQAQVLASSGVASAQTGGSTGSISIRVGSGAIVQINVDSTNNTLTGLRDAINASGADVTASIVNDGSATPYKLVLTAKSSGADNTIAVTNNLSSGALHDVVHDFAEARAAKDAQFTVNGVEISSASNTVTDVISGVTLNLLKAGDTSLSVTRDTAGIKDAVNNFVKAYNDLNSQLSSLTAYDASTGKGGALLGDSAVQSLQARLRSITSRSLPGSGGLTNLSQIGVTFQKDGTLKLDDSKLNTAIATNFATLGGLFGVQGRSASSLLTFISGGSDAQHGDYQVNITAAASQATATASSAPGLSTVIDASNDEFTVVINGVASETLAIAHGTYDANELVAAVQNALRGSSSLSQAGITATVALNGGKLSITSDTYGAASTVGGLSGTALTALGYNASESGTGTDVKGYFVINGAAVDGDGSGQFLTAAPGTAADGIKIKYVGTSTQAAADGPIALNFSSGYAAALQAFATGALDTKGSLSNRTSGINTSIKDIDKQRDDLNARLAQIETRYRTQFSALDVLIANMNTTSSFLTQQLASLQNILKQ